MIARRGVLRYLLTATGTLFAAAGARSAHAAQAQDGGRKHKVVYHLDSPDLKHSFFVLTNIRNHVNGVGGAENIELELVVHGPALKNFVVAGMNPNLESQLEELRFDDVRFGACGITMNALKITVDMLPEGLATPLSLHLPQGGVVRIMELQEQGYAYIRP